MNNLKNHSPGGIYSSQGGAKKRRRGLFAERAAVWTGCQRVGGGVGGGERKNGDGGRGGSRSCQKIWGGRVGVWLEGLFAEVKSVVGGVGGGGGGGQRGLRAIIVSRPREFLETASLSRSPPRPPHPQRRVFLHHFVLHLSLISTMTATLINMCDVNNILTNQIRV